MRRAIVRNIFGALILAVAGLGMCRAESAHPPGLSEVDWSGLKAAMLTIDGPYQQLAELGPPGPGDGDNQFGNAVAAWVDTATGTRWAVVGAKNDDNNQGAAYIFRLDPGASQWHQEARLADRVYGGAGDSFGTSVAIDGNTVAIGAPYHKTGSLTGAVYIFVRGATGQWVQQGSTLDTALHPFAFRFGESVALQGDTLAVGAPISADVFIYKRVGTTWNATVDLAPAYAGSLFGKSIALNGNRLLVGAPEDNPASVARGAAYVFVYNSATSTWDFQQKMDAFLAGTDFDSFGSSVALAGDTAVIGAPGRNLSTGAVHSFNYDAGLGVWRTNPPLSSADGASYDNFGGSVALSDGLLAVGSSGHSGSGAVYLYTGSAAAWTSAATLSAKNARLGDVAGYSIAFAGDILLSGAPLADASDFTERGRVDVFQSTTKGWIEQPPITAKSDEREFFGQSVAISGDTAVVSAAGQHNVSGSVGVANVFVRDASGIWQWQATLPHPQSVYGYGSFFGCAPVAIDDNTVLVGVPFESYGSNLKQGAVYVYARSGTAWSMLGKLVDSSGHASDLFGCSIALSGNTAVIGASGLDGSKGGAYVFVRSGKSWVRQRILTASDSAPGDQLGLSAALSGDTVVLGAPFHEGKRGAAYIFGPTGTTQVKKLVASDGATGDNFGASVALSGVTALVGAPMKSLGSAAYAGRAYLYTGSGASWPEQEKIDSPSPTTAGNFGGAVAIAGTTAAIGEWGQNAAHIFMRRGTVWSERSSAAVDTDSAFGMAVALNGSTVFIGAPTRDGGGRAYIASDADIIFADDFQ